MFGKNLSDLCKSLELLWIHPWTKRKLSVSQFVFIHSAYYFLVIFFVGEFVVGEFACGRIHWLPMRQAANVMNR